MFDGESGAKEKAAKVVSELTDSDTHKTHERPRASIDVH